MIYAHEKDYGISIVRDGLNSKKTKFSINNYVGFMMDPKFY